MSRSRLGWAAWTVSPWCLAFGVLLSFTAEAEQEQAQNASAFDRIRLVETSNPIRKALDAARRFEAVEVDGAPRPLIDTRLVVGAPDPDGPPDGVEPNGTLKDPSAQPPEVDRAGKGDPFIGRRPGFDARGRTGPSDFELPHARRDRPRDAEFDPGHTMSPLQPTGSATAPEAAGVGITDGATPSVPLEFALNTSSPTPTDGVVVEVQGESLPPQTTIAEQSPLAGGKPDYEALIDPKDQTRQMRCLAEAIYFEARSEPEAGQAAVAQVVLNRVRSGIYPTTVCGVVYQDRNRPFACQFSFACEGKSLRVEEPGPWATATRIAQEVVDGANYNPTVNEAVNYHAAYVSPFWMGYLRRVDRIGLHIFYAMREGVNWAPGALNGHGDRP
jgi:hypothetical protein